MSRRFTIACATLAGALAFAPAVKGQGRLLRIAPAEGLVSRYQMTMNLSMNSPGTQAMPAGMSMSQQLYTTMRVVAANGDTRTMAVTTDSVRGGMLGQGGPDMDGIEQRMTMDTRGRIISMDLAEQSLSPEARRAFDDVQRGLRGLGWELPEGPVSPGGTWDAQATIELPGGSPMMPSALLMNTTYRLERFEGSRAVIALNGTMSMQEGGANTGSFELSGDISGRITLDLDTGQLVDQQMTMDMTLAMGGQPTGMNVKMEFANALVR